MSIHAILYLVGVVVVGVAGVSWCFQCRKHSTSTQQADNTGSRGFIMKKVIAGTKPTPEESAFIQKHVAEAYHACSSLPLATLEQVQAVVFAHDGNPPVPFTKPDAMDGLAGTGSGAHNAILLALAGFRVLSSDVASVLGSCLFHGKPHRNTDNHAIDLASKKMGVHKCFAISYTGKRGWQACNPIWLAAIGRPLTPPEASMETATGLEAAAATLPDVAPASEAPPQETAKPKRNRKSKAESVAEASAE